MSMSLKKKVRELTADDVSQGADITTLKSDVGADDTAGLKKRCKDLEDRVKALEDAQPSGTE